MRRTNSSRFRKSSKLHTDGFGSSDRPPEVAGKHSLTDFGDRHPDDGNPPRSGAHRSRKDQINLTDEDWRIMPVAGGGFEQCYNAQAVVATTVAPSSWAFPGGDLKTPQLSPRPGRLNEARTVAFPSRGRRDRSRLSRTSVGTAPATRPRRRRSSSTTTKVYTAIHTGLSSSREL